MAAYDYRCRTCGAEFTVRRAMSEVATLQRCPQGHEDVTRMWSAVAVTGRASAPSGGGCCGGTCGCG